MTVPFKVSDSLIMMVQHDSVRAVGVEAVALEPEARDQGSVQMAGGLGPSVLG